MDARLKEALGQNKMVWGEEDCWWREGVAVHWRRDGSTCDLSRS